MLKLRIFHLADTHLGFSAYNRLDPESGLNQREVDFYSAFQKFVDVALDTKPDLILHSGDFFDSVRPTNRAISFAMDQLIRLSEANIPIVMIAGNHSTPRLRETGSVFRLFEHLENVYPIYKSKYECLDFPNLKLKVHAVPHCTDSESLHQALEQLLPDENYEFNIAMLHAAIVGVKVFRSSELNEQDVKSGYLHKNFNYIALGHYHEFCKVDENAYYSGSLERINFLEAGHQRKGFAEINLTTADDNEKYPMPILKQLPTRPMVELPTIDCLEFDPNEIPSEIQKRIESIEPMDKIIKIKVLNLPMHIYRSLDFNLIGKLTADALHFEIQYEVTKEEQGAGAAGIKFEVLGKEFSEFFAHEAIEGLDKDRLCNLGLEYLTSAGEIKKKFTE